MSLRVLLADESASIKKVFQLGLQDYAAEVKTVQSGVDVIEVAKQFAPDIIFADILLQKQNGYDVCEAIKQHGVLSRIPFVLMWSSFMELDQDRFRECQADGEIEKPFAVDRLREQIHKLVTKASEQQLSSFLQFPQSLSDELILAEKERAKGHQPKPTAQPEVPSPRPPALEVAPSFDDDEVEENSSVFNQSYFELNDDEAAEDYQEPPLVSQTQPAVQFDDHDPTNWEVKPNFEPVKKRNIMEMPSETATADEWQTTRLSASNELPPAFPPTEDNFDSFSAVSLASDHPSLAQHQQSLATPIMSPPEIQKTQSSRPPQVRPQELGDQPLDINEFLYRPGLDEDEDPPVSESRVAKIHGHDHDGPGVGGAGLPPIALTADQIKSAVLATLPMDEIEAIVRAHTQELIKLNIQEQLPVIIEKIARQELTKLLQDELAAKVGPGQ